MNDSSSRPLVRKSSPAPISRAIEERIAPRPVSPLRRAAGSLAVAAAVVLAAGGVAALAGCSEKPTAKQDERTGRDRSTRDAREEREPSKREPKEGGSALDQLVDAVGDFVDPPTRVSDPIPPASEVPRPAGTMVPAYEPPRPAGSTASPASPPPSPPKPPMKAMVGS
ncbi:MAG: hypothetical protein U0414_11425 [Polyangiaceae bacterium]